MKFVIAAVSHETNSFSPVPTPIESFCHGMGPLYGADALEAARGTATSMGAFVDRAEASGHEVVTPIFARCSPSGPVEDAAFEAIATSILEAVAAGCDAVLLDLHGAMIVESFPDGEGELLRRLRQIAPEVPVAVALDAHANVTPLMVEAADVILGYRTFPHVDIRECGDRTYDVLAQMMAGKTRPVMAFASIPLLASTLCMDTDAEPMGSVVRAARAVEERPGILAATVFMGFPLADTRDAGMSCLVIADGDAALAEAAGAELLSLAWERREAFVYTPEPLTESLDRAELLAKTAGPGPVLLIDHADNCNSGGTLDSMTVVRAVMARGLRDVGVAPVCDPEAARQLLEAGVGSSVTLRLGEKMPAPLVARGAEAPLELVGKVLAVSDGALTVTGPVFTGTRLNMGPCAAFEAEGIVFVVTSRRVEPYDPGVLSILGIELARLRYLVLKSRIQYRPAFLPLAAGKVDCNGAGVAASDLALFDFRHVRRPMYPLDPDVEWPAGGALATASTNPPSEMSLS